jgi:transglutaminase-like putative cysteine protease
MIFEVSHRTTYGYRSPVSQSHHLLHLAPRAMPNQVVWRHSLLVEPPPASRADFLDSFANPVTVLSIEEDHSELVIHARNTVEIRPPPVADLAATSPWQELDGRFARGGDLDLEVLQFTCASRQTRPTPEILEYARPSFAAGRPVLECAWDLSRRLFADLVFDPDASDVSTPVSQVLEQRRGVCQDFAHLALTCLRAFEVPARYVSGYLLTRPPAGKERLQGADASHAWISVWAPETDWVDFDPTNGLRPAEEHIAIAYGRDFDDVSPISGVLVGGGEQTVAVAVDVTLAA